MAEEMTLKRAFTFDHPVINDIKQKCEEWNSEPTQAQAAVCIKIARDIERTVPPP